MSRLYKGYAPGGVAAGLPRARRARPPDGDLRRFPADMAALRALSFSVQCLTVPL